MSRALSAGRKDGHPSIYKSIPLLRRGKGLLEPAHRTRGAGSRRPGSSPYAVLPPGSCPPLVARISPQHQPCPPIGGRVPAKTVPLCPIAPSPLERRTPGQLQHARAEAGTGFRTGPVEERWPGARLDCPLRWTLRRRSASTHFGRQLLPMPRRLWPRGQDGLRYPRATSG